MSLKTMPTTKIFNALSSGTVTVSGSTVSIPSMGITFDTGDVVNCNRTCTTACTPQVVTVTPVIPTAPCECPWTFELILRRLSCGFERAQDVFEKSYVFNYLSPTGDLPTAANICTSIYNQIMTDPNRIVTVVNNGTTLTLTERDCDSIDRTCGFAVYGNVTVSVGTAHVDAILPIWEVQRNFPVIPGSEFGNPTTAFCGTTYCKYYFHIKPYSTVRHTHISNAYVSREMELEIWVRSDLANITTDWDTELTGVLTCLGSPLT